MLDWMTHKLESRLLWEIQTIWDIQMITTLVAESKGELKSLLMRVKEEIEKVGFKTQHSKNEDHGIWSHYFVANRRGKSGNSDRFSLLMFQNHCGQWMQHEIKIPLLLARKAMTNLESILKNRAITLPTKFLIVKTMIFPLVMYRCEELDDTEGWALKNWCFRSVVLEKTLERESKEIKPVIFKRNQPWINIGKTDAKAEAMILWPPDA